MNAITIINKKRRGLCLTNEELTYMIMGYVEDKIPDYQMSALLMAICINGMTEEEIFNMTDIMIHSGQTLDFSFLGDSVVDKHSTGGVGDKTTLVLAPLVSSTGVTVAKMSGRGLGFTGGTIDKLESIQGFQTSISNEEFMNQVKNIHLAVVSGNHDLVPADKKIYALRDVTGTVESIPLIASSIMSKKIAAGTKKIVIDVKVGEGALMKDIKSARELAHTMIEIGKRYQVKVVCVLSNMSEPLGYAIGNGLEVKESIEALQGNYAPDFLELTQTLASEMVALGLSIPINQAKEKINYVMSEHLGYDKFLEMVTNQHGNIHDICISDHIVEVKSKKSGYIHFIDAYSLALIASSLGAGRENLEDEIDHGVGIWLLKKSGDVVIEGETLAKVYIGKKDFEEDKILSAFEIKEEAFKRKSIILEIMK
jgi:pyrimidine-nucleoside phosphorylase